MIVFGRDRVSRFLSFREPFQFMVVYYFIKFLLHCLSRSRSRSGGSVCRTLFPFHTHFGVRAPALETRSYRSSQSCE